MNLTDSNTHAPTDQPGDGPTLLTRFRELQELELAVKPPGIIEAAILSSVRSTGIQKVSLVHFPRHVIDWKIFDKPLCRLAECTRGLDVDFRIISMEVREARKVARIVDSLVEFREKGQMRVVWVGPGGNESIAYPPGNRPW